jgi:hypothetical protein
VGQASEAHSCLVLAFHAPESPLCRWIVWRNAEIVFVQPLIGRTRRYGSIAEAMATLMPPRRFALINIKAERWPS